MEWGKILDSKYIIKGAPLFFTAAPGGARIILFWILSHKLDVDVFAEFSSLYSLCILISITSGVGIGTSLIKNDYELNFVNFVKFCVFGLVISIPIFIVISLNLKLQIYLASAVFLGIGFILNQMYRYLIIKEKKFIQGCIYEILLTCLMFVLALISNRFLLISLSAIYVILTSFFLSKSSISHIEKLEKTIKYKEIFYIGYSSLLSSGIIFFMPTVSLYLTDPYITRIISLLSVFIGIISIIPRAIVNNNLKEIKFFLSNIDIKYFNLREILYKKIYIFLFISSIIFFIYSFCISILFHDRIILGMIIAVSYFSFNIIAQINIIESISINFIGREFDALILNLLIFILFIILVLMLRNSDLIYYKQNKIVLLNFYIFILYVGRYFIFCNMIGRYLK